MKRFAAISDASMARIAWLICPFYLRNSDFSAGCPIHGIENHSFINKLCVIELFLTPYQL